MRIETIKKFRTTYIEYVLLIIGNTALSVCCLSSLLKVLKHQTNLIGSLHWKRTPPLSPPSVYHAS